MSPAKADLFGNIPISITDVTTYGNKDDDEAVRDRGMGDGRFGAQRKLVGRGAEWIGRD